MDHTKIRTFERLFRSWKYEQNKTNQKDRREEKICREIRKILEEIELQSERKTQKADPVPKISAGQYMVLCGPIGTGGTIFMAKYFREKLSKVFPGWIFRDALELESQMHQYPTEEILEKYDISAIYFVGEGGLRKTLHQLGKDTGMGYEVHARRVPVNQITIEFCEQFDLDPWSMLSGGCVLLTCSRPAGLLEELRSQKFQAEVIGVMTSSKEKVIIHGRTRSLVNRPKADSLLTLIYSEFAW